MTVELEAVTVVRGAALLVARLTVAALTLPGERVARL